MNTPEDETRVIRPNYILPAVLLMGLGYYIAFEIAEQPETQNAFLLKILGLGNMVVFGIAFIVGLKSLFIHSPKANPQKENNY